MTFYVGAVARVSAVFKVGTIETDPTTITLSVKAPGGVTTNHVFGSSAMARDAAGRYRFDIACAEAGNWAFVWTGTGAAAAVNVGGFIVRPTGL